ncbi:hypothetical protein GCM10009760_51360 [Kitasatospora kazusensis]|uniref:Anti-sigma factor antagonist n=1 Tax=Kitasatospora kazusensis TaxID=407974 RepID=A0ABP5LUC6_9ACTN
METITTACKCLTISYEHISAKTTVLTVVGGFDVYTSPTFRAVILDVISQGHVQLIVDLKGCDFMDSTGTGVLVGALKRTRALGGGVACTGPDRAVMKMFRITGLAKVFPFYDSVAQAEERLLLWAVGAGVAVEAGPVLLGHPASGDRPPGGPASPGHPASCPGLDLVCVEEAGESAKSALLTLSGCLDRESAKRLRAEIRALSERGRTHLAVDLNGVTFLEGPGAGALVGGLRLLRGEGGTLTLALAESPLLKVFRTLGLVKVFEIHDAAPEALRSLACAA